MFESMQPVMSDFITTLVTGILGVLSAFLIACAKKGFDWISTKIDKVKNDTAREAFNNALGDLYQIVDTSVTSLQQTLGDEIKKSIEANDGKYTREDLLGLKDKALEIINHQLSESSKEALSTVYSDLDSFIADLIETKVRELKG